MKRETPAAVRMVGFHDQPYRSQRFSGDGYYAFTGGNVHHKAVSHARVDDHWGIGLSDGPDDEVRIYVSHRTFDRICWGKWMTVEEADRASGRTA